MKLLPLFQIASPKIVEPSPEDEDEEEDKPVDSGTAFPDLIENFFYFEQIGVSLPKQEQFCIALAIRKLAQSQPIKKVRFWGKILGTKKDYFVAEADMQEEEYSKRTAEIHERKEKERALLEEQGKELELLQQEEEKINEIESEEREQKEEDEEDKAVTKVKPVKPKPLYTLPPLPKAEPKPEVEVPPEDPGEGVNKKVYYVCNEPGEDWTMLPDVAPKQIVVARQIKRYFTGDLYNEILTYPQFPGQEINYLRAQIARISAGSQVSPTGFYRFGSEEDEEEEDEDEDHSAFLENPNYEPLPLWELLDISFSNWVHHAPHILPQGRTKWWHPKKAADEYMEEEDEEEDEDEAFDEYEQREVGPQLLTSLSEDASIEATPPWSLRVSSQVLPEFAVASIWSNLWPGACAFTFQRKCENIYIGWGHKYVSHNFFPQLAEPVQTEYPIGPEVMEMFDPTVAEEEAWQQAHEAKQAKEEVVDEGIEDEEEEEGEEDDEEDDEF